MEPVEVITCDPLTLPFNGRVHPDCLPALPVSCAVLRIRNEDGTISVACPEPSAYPPTTVMDTVPVVATPSVSPTTQQLPATGTTDQTPYVLGGGFALTVTGIALVGLVRLRRGMERRLY